MAGRGLLRTKAGCLTCRSRKKKCDELKPRCMNCQRGGIGCQWPTKLDDAQDRRYRRPPQNQVKRRASLSIDARTPYNLLTVASSGDTVQLAFYLYAMLPSLVHDRSHALYKNSEYTIHLVQDYEPMRNIALACSLIAASSKPSIDPQWSPKAKALAFHHRALAVAEINEGIATGKVVGSEDWLLLATNQMHLFDENEMSADASKATVFASLNLLSCRQAAKKKAQESHKYQNASSSDGVLPALGFERLCYEAILHHGVTVMMFDRHFQFDTLPGWQIIQDYFEHSPLPAGSGEENWPITGIPFQLYRLVIAVTRLTRKRAMSQQDLMMAKEVLMDLAAWFEVIGPAESISTRYFYLVAAHALMWESIRRQPGGLLLLTSDCIADYDFTTVLEIMDRNPSKGGFHLWPLSVFNMLLSDRSDRKALGHLMSRSLPNKRGSDNLAPTEEVIEHFLNAPGLREI